ncbi:MAG: MarR family transcriptional regulator [Pseudomonadota bacterium]
MNARAHRPCPHAKSRKIYFGNAEGLKQGAAQISAAPLPSPLSRSFKKEGLAFGYICKYLHIMRNHDDYPQSLGVSALGSRLRRLFENLNGTVTQLYREGLGFEQRWFTLTFLLKDKHEISVQTAADMLGTSHVAVLQVAKAMEGAGLLQRKKSVDDRRVVFLLLTPEGVAMAEKVSGLSRQVDTAAQALIDDAAPNFIAQLTALENALRKQPFSTRLNAVRSEPLLPKDRPHA